MMDWLRRRSLFTRLLTYAAAVTLAFVLAASVGALAALVVSGDLGWPARERAASEQPSSAGERPEHSQHKQADAERTQQGHTSANWEHTIAKRGQATPEEIQTTYIDAVGEIQADSVKVYLDSHEKLLRYDALDSRDIEEMQADQAVLQGLANQASGLRAPQKYKDQKEVFRSAIEKLHQAAQLAYTLAADPASATQSGFQNYESNIDKAADLLKRSNELLDRDFETIEGVRSVSPS